MCHYRPVQPRAVPQELRKRIVSPLEDQQRGWVSQNMWQRSQADTDSWHGLFDTQAGAVARVFSLSI
jgi:hypothetical protein